MHILSFGVNQSVLLGFESLSLSGWGGDAAHHTASVLGAFGDLCSFGFFRTNEDVGYHHNFKSAQSKDILVMHAEGQQGGLEYDLRRLMTQTWDPDRNPDAPRDARLAIKSEAGVVWCRESRKRVLGAEAL